MIALKEFQFDTQQIIHNKIIDPQIQHAGASPRSEVGECTDLTQSDDEQPEHKKVPKSILPDIDPDALPSVAIQRFLILSYAIS